MADIRDPNTLHCRKDTRAVGGADCHGESYCACQCDACKAANECAAAWYAAHPPPRESPDERLARALFRAFDEHVHVPPELEQRLLRRMRSVIDEIGVDIPAVRIVLNAQRVGDAVATQRPCRHCGKMRAKHGEIDRRCPGGSTSFWPVGEPGGG